MSIEARVGAFVLVALAVLIGFVFALGDVTFGRTFSLAADFGFTGGLQAGAPVKVSGIRIGKVQRTLLLGPDVTPAAAAPVSELGRNTRPIVRAVLSIDDSARPFLGDGARIAVGIQGIVGEAYLEVTPGTGTALAEGTAVRGVDAPALHAMALQLSALLSAVSGVAGSEDGSGLGRELGTLLGTVNEVVSTHKEELGRAITDLTAASTDLRGILGEVRGAIDQGALNRFMDDAGTSAETLRRDLPAVMAQAKLGLTQVSELLRKAETALDAEAVQGIIGDMRQAAKNLEAASLGGKRLVQTLERGEGTVGGLMKDPQVYDDLKEMLRDLKKNPWKVFWRD